MQGLSQGNSAASGTWVRARSAMIHTQKSAGVSNTIPDVISRVVFTFSMFQLVDNTDLSTMGHEGRTADAVFE